MTNDRQIATVLNLAIAPHGYEIRSYSVDRMPRIGGDFLPHLEVRRTYGREDMGIEYHECVFVGPRGGCKTIYKSLY
jgi:hypothetical protein